MKIIIEGVYKRQGYGNMFDMSGVSSTQQPNITLNYYKGEKEQKEFLELTIGKDPQLTASVERKTVISIEDLLRAVQLFAKSKVEKED